MLGTSLAWVLALRGVQALGVGCIAASVSTVAARWFPAEQRGIVTGFQGMSVTLGAAIGFLATPVAYAATGTWRSAMLWLTVGCLLGLVLTLLIPFGPAPAEAACRSDECDRGAFGLACRQPATWLVVAIMFCLSWVYCAFNDLTPGYLAIEPPVGVGYGPMLGGKLMVLMQLSAMVGSVATGFVFEKVFKGKASPVLVIGYSLFALTAVAIMAPVIYSKMPYLVACLVLAGFFQAWVVPNVLAFYSLHYPAHITGSLAGMSFGIALFGGTTGIMAGAFALHRTGNYRASIVMVGAVAVFGLVLSLFLKPPAILADGS
jgi:MFS family permease